MSYENLAAKYRPRNLEEVVGQDTIKQTLANSVKLARLAHAYVFYGPRGCGKTTIARILAKTLNCSQPKDGKPCDKCSSCAEIAESKSLDVIEIDAASHTDVENIRNVIIENVGLAPSRDKYKVYILDEVHMLSKQSFNALLKTIEEPPSHVVFIMATTEQTKVPVTILSRSQCFRFRPIPEDLITARLKEITAKEKLKVADEALAVIARSASGAMRDALTLLDRAASFGKGAVEVDVLNELLGHASSDLITETALALAERNAAGLYAAFEKISKEGYDPLTILRDLRNSLAETFFYVQGFSKNKTALAEKIGKEISPIALAKLSRKLNAVIEEVKFSDAPAIAAEIALFTLIETPQDLEALVRRLETLEGRPGAISVPPTRLEHKEPESQKKNEKLAEPVIGPDTDPGDAQESPEPAAQPQPAETGMPAATAWKKLLGTVSAKKPILYNVLLSVKVSFGDAGSWKLSSGNKFEADIIERSRKELEDILERLTGRKISFSVEHRPGVTNEAPEPELPTGDDPEVLEVPDEALPEQPVPAEGKWEEVSASKTAEEEPELKKLAKVFHGRITRIQKIK